MTDDAGIRLLAAIEAMHQELREMREHARMEREAKAELTQLRRTAADRQARARQRHGTGGFAVEIRERIYARDGHKCLACGTGERLSIDHIVPRVKGGDDDLSNLQTLCIPCNAKKNGGDFRVTSVTQHHVTPEVVKALDLKQRDQDQDQDPPASRDVTPVTQRPAPTAAAWESYAAAYEERHGVRPADGKAERGKLKRFIEKVAKDEAPLIAAFYLTHNDALYIRAKHPIDLLVRDAQRLRTEWKTGKRGTATAARQIDQTQANLDGWAELMSEEGRRALVSK